MYVAFNRGFVECQRITVTVVKESLVHPLELPPLGVVLAIHETVVHDDRRDHVRFFLGRAFVCDRLFEVPHRFPHASGASLKEVVEIFVFVHLDPFGTEEIEQATRAIRVAELLESARVDQFPVPSPRLHFLSLRPARPKSEIKPEVEIWGWVPHG